MKDKKTVALKVVIDEDTEYTFKKIIEKKGTTIQGFLKELIDKCILDNLGLLREDGTKK